VSSEDAAPAEVAPPAGAASPVERAKAKVGRLRQLEPVQRLVLAVVVLCALLLVWYVVADRLTPYTANGRVKGFLVPIVPEVSGYVAAVGVHKNDLVDAGQTLLQIDTKRFELAEDSARAALDLAGQDVGASTAGVDAAVAHVAEARTRFESVSAQSRRVIGIEETGAVAKAQVDQARAEIDQARAQLEKSEAELERAKQQLGQAGGDNPRTRAAVAALEQARLDLARTTIVAPSRGMISGLQIDEGHYARAGEPLMTFMAIGEAWLEGYFTENNLGRVEVGDEVEIAFDMFPGEIFHGTVASLAGGISTGKTTALGDLPTASKPTGWLRAPQRFPVVIKPTDYTFSDAVLLRLNSQVDVIVYTGDHPFWNALGRLWIRFMSWLSYAY